MTSEQPSPFPPGLPITTQRLCIQPFDPENLTHCKFLAQLWNTDDFINSCGKTSIDSPEKAAAFIRRRILADYAQNRHGQFLVSRLEENDPAKLIGCVSLMKGSPPGPHYLAPDIGFTILPEESGKGFASEAARELIDWARRELDIHAVFGFCAPDNARSRRVLEKSGLEYRGSAALRVFGDQVSAIYALPDMDSDLGVYNMTEEVHGAASEGS